jgi:hypothetical protein
MKQETAAELLANRVARLYAVNHVLNEYGITQATYSLESMILLQGDIERMIEKYYPIILEEAAEWISEIDRIRMTEINPN